MVNPSNDKKAAIEKENKYDLTINNSTIITFVDSVTLSGIGMDNKLNFQKHIVYCQCFYKFVSSIRV